MSGPSHISLNIVRSKVIREPNRNTSTALWQRGSREKALWFQIPSGQCMDDEIERKMKKLDQVRTLQMLSV